MRSYLRAARQAAQGRWYRAPAALLSVLRARLLHSIGPYYHSMFDLGRQPASEWRQFISERHSNPRIVAINGRARVELADDKVAFAAHCLVHGIPTVPIICRVCPSREDSPDDAGIARSEKEFEALLSGAGSRVFGKPIDGSHGKGAFVAVRDGEGWRFAGRQGSAGSLYRFCVERMSGRGWLFQPVVVPHPELAPIMANGAMGTVRIMTWLDGGVPRALLPVLRLPAGGNVTDNFGGGTTGNLVAPIDLETGVLGAAWISGSRSWPEPRSTDVHPDTHEPIRGRTVPMWRETVDVVLRGQASTPALPTLGWDVAITSRGPIIIEANPNWGTDILQAAHRRGVRNDLAPVFALAPHVT